MIDATEIALFGFGQTGAILGAGLAERGERRAAEMRAHGIDYDLAIEFDWRSLIDTLRLDC